MKEYLKITLAFIVTTIAYFIWVIGIIAVPCWIVDITSNWILAAIGELIWVLFLIPVICIECYIMDVISKTNDSKEEL